MPRRVGAEMGERGVEEGQMEGGLSLQVGWEARSFVETGPRSWSMPTHQEADRGVGSIPSFGGLSDLPMMRSSPQLWEEVSCGLAGPS